MFEGWQSTSTTCQMTLSILVELMTKQERDITFGAYANGILKAIEDVPEDVKTKITKHVVKPVADDYAKVAHEKGRWKGYEWSAPEQVYTVEYNFKDALYEKLIEFLFSNGYQDEQWSLPIREFTSTAPWKLEPYN